MLAMARMIMRVEMMLAEDDEDESSAFLRSALCASNNLSQEVRRCARALQSTAWYNATQIDWTVQF